MTDNSDFMSRYLPPDNADAAPRACRAGGRSHRGGVAAGSAVARARRAADHRSFAPAAADADERFDRHLRAGATLQRPLAAGDQQRAAAARGGAERAATRAARDRRRRRWARPRPRSARRRHRRAPQRGAVAAGGWSDAPTGEPDAGGRRVPPPPRSSDRATVRAARPAPQRRGPRHASTRRNGGRRGRTFRRPARHPPGMSRSRKSSKRRREPAEMGWRKAVYVCTGGLVNLGAGLTSAQLRDWKARVTSNIPGNYQIAAVSVKGGVGKTRVTAGVGTVFAGRAQRSTVIAIDADTTYGGLGRFVDPKALTSIRDFLAAKERVVDYPKARRFTGQNKQGLEVLAGNQNVANPMDLDATTFFDTVSARRAAFTSCALVDCGAEVETEFFKAVLSVSDALMIIGSCTAEGGLAIETTVDWLAARNGHELLKRSVIVLNDTHDSANKAFISHISETVGTAGALGQDDPVGSASAGCGHAGLPGPAQTHPAGVFGTGRRAGRRVPHRGGAERVTIERPARQPRDRRGRTGPARSGRWWRSSPGSPRSGWCLDATAPVSVQLAALVDLVNARLDELGQPALTAGPRGRWTLCWVDGTALKPGLSLAAQGVSDGTRLWLRFAADTEARINVVEHVTSAVAAELSKRWPAVTPVWAARVGAGMVVAGVLAATALLGRWRYGHLGWAAGRLLRRAGGAAARGGGDHLGAPSAPSLARGVGDTLLLTGCVPAAVAAAAAVPGPVGAPHAALGLATVLVAAVLVVRFTGRHIALGTAVIVTAAAGVAGGVGAHGAGDLGADPVGGAAVGGADRDACGAHHGALGGRDSPAGVPLGVGPLDF